MERTARIRRRVVTRGWRVRSWTERAFGVSLLATIGITAADPSFLGWWAVLTGIGFIGLGLLTIGGSWAAHTIEQMYPQHLRDPVGRVLRVGQLRTASPLGLTEIALGLGLIGSTAAHAAIAGAFVIIAGYFVARSEVTLRKSGEAHRFIPAFYPLRTVFVLLLVAADLTFIGLVVDRSIVLVDPISPGTPALIQAVLGAQIALGALAIAGVGLSLQLRAPNVGGDVALLMARSKILWISGFGLVTSILLTGLTLGNLEAWRDVGDGRVVDLALLWAVGSAASFVAASGRVVQRYSSSYETASFLASSVLSAQWREEILDASSWRPHRRPESVRRLFQAVGVRNLIRPVKRADRGCLARSVCATQGPAWETDIVEMVNRTSADGGPPVSRTRDPRAVCFRLVPAFRREERLPPARAGSHSLVIIARTGFCTPTALRRFAFDASWAFVQPVTCGVSKLGHAASQVYL